MIDKYDFIVIKNAFLGFFLNAYKERKEFLPRYLRWKKEHLIMEFYALRNKKSADYRKNKGKPFKPVVHKAGELDLEKERLDDTNFKNFIWSRRTKT